MKLMTRVRYVKYSIFRAFVIWLYVMLGAHSPSLGRKWRLSDIWNRDIARITMKEREKQ